MLLTLDVYIGMKIYCYVIQNFLLLAIFCCFIRWKRDTAGNIISNPKSGKKILQFVAIVRRDHGVWAIPGVSNYLLLANLCDNLLISNMCITK